MSAAALEQPASVLGPTPRVWNFNTDAPGAIPPGFTSAAGRWEVVADGENRVLAQKAKNDDATFNVALIGGTRYKDLDLSVRLRAVAGEVDRGGGLVWRARDARNYYVARYNPLEDNFRVYKVQDGKRSQFQSAKVPGDEAWHTLRVTMVGPKIVCRLDGKRLLEVEDTTFPDAGMIGFWTKADAQSYFDDLSYVTATSVALAQHAGPMAAEPPARETRPTREADQRGMVVMVGLLSPRKDQDLYDDAAIRRAIEETARFLVQRQLKNVFVDLMHEFDQPERIDHELLREPDGANKKARLTKWFKDVAPDIEAGICPMENSDTADTYPGMDVRIIQKGMPIPSAGFVVNVETSRQDFYENDGIFNPGARTAVEENCRRYLEAPNAVMLFHAASVQGLSNGSRTAPHPEMGGYGTSPNDRGVRFYYEWVRDHVGRWEYPRHVK